ncbi:MAG TPA: hypothetical protein VKB69_00295 [Micromonosporaceae bacterium]|nr:hypothetical protein [Micromonosporaceae bacterium]
MRGSRFFAALVAAAVVAGGIGVGVARSTAGDHGTVTGDGTALFNYVLAPPLDAFEMTDDIGGTNGVFTLDEFTRMFYGDDWLGIRDDLTALRFQAMAERSWVGVDGIEFDVDLVEFDTAQHAHTFLGTQVGLCDSDGTFGPSFSAAGDRGVGFESVNPDRFGFREAQLLADQGNVVVIVLAFAPGPLNRAEETGVLTDQLVRLPR